MNEDLQLILGIYLLQWITLFVLVFIAKNKRKILIFNFGIQLAYSILFIFSFSNSGSGGGVLALIVIWFVCIGAHWVSSLIHLIILLIIKSKKKSTIQKQ